MNIFYKIRKWFQPYWNPLPPELKDEALAKKGKKTKQAKEEENVEEIKPNLPFTPSKMKVRKIKLPIDDLLKNHPDKRPKPDEIWFYRDNKKHQILAHVLPKTRFRYQDERSDEERAKLKPFMKPVGEKYDRTHLIPFGYIGTENDPRLVVPWNQVQNRNDLGDFENRQSNRDEALFWFTSISRTKYGAKWFERIYSVDDDRLVDGIDLAWGTSTKPVKIEWKQVD